MKTIIGVLCLLAVLAGVGVMAAKELHKVTTAAGGSNAVLYSSAQGATSAQQIQQNLEHTVENAVPQGQPHLNDD